MSAEQSVVHVGNKGDPLTPFCNICNSEVPHSCDPTLTGNDSWLSYLKSGGHSVAVEGVRLGQVLDCLSENMYSDGLAQSMSTSLCTHEIQ